MLRSTGCIDERFSSDRERVEHLFGSTRQRSLLSRRRSHVVGSGRREGDRGCSSLEGPDQRHGLGWHRPVGWDEAEAGLSATRYLCWATLASAKLEAGKSYTFVLAGKPRKYDIVKIEDAVAVQPNQ